MQVVGNPQRLAVMIVRGVKMGNLSSVPRAVTTITLMSQSATAPQWAGGKFDGGQEGGADFSRAKKEEESWELVTPKWLPGKLKLRSKWRDHSQNQVISSLYIQYIWINEYCNIIVMWGLGHLWNADETPCREKRKLFNFLNALPKKTKQKKTGRVKVKRKKKWDGIRGQDEDRVCLSSMNEHRQRETRKQRTTVVALELLRAGLTRRRRWWNQGATEKAGKQKEEVKCRPSKRRQEKLNRKSSAKATDQDNCATIIYINWLFLFDAQSVAEITNASFLVVVQAWCP